MQNILLEVCFLFFSSVLQCWFPSSAAYLSYVNHKGFPEWWRQYGGRPVMNETRLSALWPVTNMSQSIVSKGVRRPHAVWDTLFLFELAWNSSTLELSIIIIHNYPFIIVKMRYLATLGILLLVVHCMYSLWTFCKSKEFLVKINSLLKLLTTEYKALGDYMGQTRYIIVQGIYHLYPSIPEMSIIWFYLYQSDVKIRGTLIPLPSFSEPTSF